MTPRPPRARRIADRLAKHDLARLDLNGVQHVADERVETAELPVDHPEDLTQPRLGRQGAVGGHVGDRQLHGGQRVAQVVDHGRDVAELVLARPRQSVGHGVLSDGDAADLLGACDRGPGRQVARGEPIDAAREPLHRTEHELVDGPEKEQHPRREQHRDRDAENVRHHVDRPRPAALGVRLGGEQVVDANERAHQSRGKAGISILRGAPVALQLRGEVFEQLPLVNRAGQIHCAGEGDPPLALRQRAAHRRRLEFVADRLMGEAGGDPRHLMRAVDVVHGPSHERREEHQSDAGGQRDQAKPDRSPGQSAAELHQFLDGDRNLPRQAPIAPDPQLRRVRARRFRPSTGLAGLKSLGQNPDQLVPTPIVQTPEVVVREVGVAQLQERVLTLLLELTVTTDSSPRVKIDIQLY